MLRAAGKIREVSVSGADHQEWAYLNDLTTKGTRNTPYTNPVDRANLAAKDTKEIRKRVPGIQIDGYFRDDSKTTKEPGNNYGNRKFPHDAQFVIRFPNPDDWNGKLVVTGPSGVRGQYANDFLINDFVLAKGYAYASTDKGNSGLRFYCGDRMRGDAMAEWHQRVRQLAIAAKGAATRYYERYPERTYVTGISNGGYLTRYALENDPQLYDGGVDWEGPLWRPEGPNLLTFLPPALKHFPVYAEKKDQDAYKKIIEAGFEPDSEFLWNLHYIVYWGVTQRIYREVFDPEYSGVEAEYNYATRVNPDLQQGPQERARAQETRDAVARVSLSGDIGKPLITLHGTLDTLIPIKMNSDEYTRLIDKAGKSHLHRYYTIEGGNHVDSFYDFFPGKLQPILPCYRASFEAL